MKLRIVRVSLNQFVELSYAVRPQDRWVVDGLPTSHFYLPGEKIIIVPDTEFVVVDFPEDEGLSLAGAIQCAMEGK